MKAKIAKFFKKSFVRNVTLLASGTALAQLIGLILSPVITRLYGPEAFGMMSVFSAIAQIFVPIAALTYPIAIVLPKKDDDAKRLIRLSIYISITFAILVALGLLFFNESIVNLFQIGDISAFLYLIPLIILSAGLVQVSEQWLIRKNQFGISAKVAFLQSIIINGSKVGVGLFYPVTSVLIILTAATDGLKALMMIYYTRKRKLEYNQSIRTRRSQLAIKDIANRYKDFPLFRAPEVLINSFSQRLPILMLTTFFGPISAGFYSISKVVLDKPIQLIGKSVGDVFYPRISEAVNNNENVSSLIKKATLALGLLGIVPFGVIIIFGPNIFSLVFGHEWAKAGEYSQWIAIYLYFEFINKPSVRALPVLSAQLFHLKFTIIILIARVTSLSVGFLVFSSDIIAIALFGTSSALLNFILIIVVIKKSKSFSST